MSKTSDMKFLVVGAGAVGSYFGGRLLQAGHDVSFLARPGRAAQLAARGLAIRSPTGNLQLPSPTVLASRQIQQPYDVVIVACKAYDLEAAMVDFAPAVGADTAILPLLNGMRHLDLLVERFGRRSVLGGACVIAASVDETGAIEHAGPEHTLLFGELEGERTARIDRIAQAFGQARFEGQASDRIVQDMWEKWIHIATLASLTALLRANVGDIVSAGAQHIALDLLDECCRIAAFNAHAPREKAIVRTRAALCMPGSVLTGSMYHDIERGEPTESEHILGDLLRRGRWSTADTRLLPVAYAQFRSHEARRAREAQEAARPRRLVA
ncbi:ketopantoate reductase family protein [Variovorax sp. dw_954]|uniref:ketopantoate reductase family protein n=1 Tax=Variovorax sp. dw_954 TaxID=2720078 RepID=UPI0031F5FADA